MAHTFYVFYDSFLPNLKTSQDFFPLFLLEVLLLGVELHLVYVHFDSVLFNVVQSYSFMFIFFF